MNFSPGGGYNILPAIGCRNRQILCCIKTNSLSKCSAIYSIREHGGCKGIDAFIFASYIEKYLANSVLTAPEKGGGRFQISLPSHSYSCFPKLFAWPPPPRCILTFPASSLPCFFSEAAEPQPIRGRRRRRRLPKAWKSFPSFPIFFGGETKTRDRHHKFRF